MVTLGDRLLGDTTTNDGWVYVVAQIAGACVGAIVANLMFDASGGHRLDARSIVDRAPARRIRRDLRVGPRDPQRRARGSVAQVAVAVGGFIAAAYWFTSSTSFANPAVTIGRTLTNTFAGISPASAAPFIAAQLAGGLAAVALCRVWYVERVPA